MNFVYTDHVSISDSSVIDSLSYDAVTGKLVVELLNGTFAGYDNVPEGVWDNFKAEDRLGGSVGRYWNNWIKPNHVGFTTSDIDTLVTEQEHASGTWGSEAVNRPVDASVSDVEVTAAAETDAPEIDVQNRWDPAKGVVPVNPVVDVKAGADLGQRSYEITYEVVVKVEQRKAVVYAANDVEAERDFLADVDEVNIVDVRRRF